MNLQVAHTLRGSAERVDAVGVLLRDLIDYAGLFPPASLAMAAAGANYRAYSQSESSWLLGRFIVPVARLGEFEEAFVELPISERGASGANLRLSVLLGSDALADVARIRQFNAQMTNASSSPKAAIEAVEVKAANADEAAWLSGIVPAELTTYFEVPLDESFRVHCRGR